MARATIKFPNDFLEQVASMSEKFEPAVQAALKDGGDVVLSTMRSNLQRVVGNETKEKTRSTGQLVAALGVSPVKLDRNGNYDLKIGFAENRSDGKINAMLANIIEYGSSHRARAARPFLAPTKKSARGPAIEAIKNRIRQELGI